MRFWTSPDRFVFGPDRPFDDKHRTDLYWESLADYQMFVIDNASPDYES